MGLSKKRLPVLGGRKRWLRSLLSNRKTNRIAPKRHVYRHTHNRQSQKLHDSIACSSSSFEQKAFISSNQLNESLPSKTPDKTSVSNIHALKLGRKEKNGPSLGLAQEKLQNSRVRFDAEQHHQRKPLYRSEDKKPSIRTGRDSDGSDAVPGQLARKRVDAETLQYFEEIYSLLSTEAQVEDMEERMALIENALEETHGKECEMACEKSCSRVLETLIRSSNSTQVASFLHRLSPYFFAVSVDAAGSHVAETLLKSAAMILRGINTETAWFKMLEQALTIICQVLGEHIVDVLSNCYGSHVVRSLLSLLSGIPPQHLQGGYRGSGRLNRLSLSQNSAGKEKGGDIIFPNLLKLLIGKMLGAAEDKTLWLCMDPFASPVMQALLRVLANDCGHVTKALCIFLGSNKETVDYKEDKALGQKLQQLIFDNFGSHLVEVMFEVAPDDIYEAMFQQVMASHLLEYSLHPSANYVVQALIVSIRKHEQLALLVSELKPNFWTLIKGKRSGIIFSLLKACKKHQSSEQEMCSTLVKATNSDAAKSSNLVSRFLYLEGYASSDRSNHWKPRLKEKMSVLGCTMLQLIFTFPMECNQLFWLSLLELEASEILATVKDAGGSHVIDSFLSSEIPSKHKNRLIAKLKGHFAELASNVCSAFTLAKCFRVGTTDLKESIVSELVTIQAELAKMKHGPYYIHKFDLTRYSKAPEHWRTRMVTREETLKAFADVFDLTGAPVKRSRRDDRKPTGLEPELVGNKKRKMSL